MVRFLLACVLASATSLVFADTDNADDPWVILNKAAQAARELSYKGVFTYQSGMNARSVEITHMNTGKDEYSRIVMLDGSPREVLSQGADVVIFSPKNEKVVVEKRRGQNMFPALFPANMDAIKLNYKARLGGQERIGGREGRIVFLEPRDQYRYSYKFWTDVEYGLLLKSMTSNPQKQVMEKITFNQLNLVGTENMDWFQPSLNNKKSYVMEEMAPLVTPAIVENWTLAALPAGFRKIDQLKRKVPGKKTPVNQIVFSDGLASVSVFIEPLIKGVRPKMGHAVMGATNFYANVTDGYQIMVVGEVPQETVTQIANAVSFNNP
jgi:sigma-E factor negative regulatory protein RseB